jgi:hypothetical protein
MSAPLEDPAAAVPGVAFDPAWFWELRDVDAVLAEWTEQAEETAKNP